MQYLTVDLGMTLLYLKSKALLCVFKIFQGKVDLRLLFKWQLVFLNVLRTLYGSKGPTSLGGGYKNFRKIAIYVIHLSANLASETISTRRFSFFEPCVIFIKIFNEKKMYWHLHYVSGLSEILICLPHFSISMLPSVKKKTVTKFFHHCLGRRKDFQINN